MEPTGKLPDATPIPISLMTKEWKFLADCRPDIERIKSPGSLMS
jgi:hypothetical protein